MRQLLFGDTGHSLEVIMAGIAEVCGTKAKEHSHRAAVPAFIFQEVCAVLGAHLVKGKPESSVVNYIFVQRKQISSILKNKNVCILGIIFLLSNIFDKCGMGKLIPVSSLESKFAAGHLATSE